MTGFLLRNDSGQTIHAGFRLYNSDNKEYLLTSLSSLVCFLIYFSSSFRYLFLLIAGLNSVHPGKECSHRRLQKVDSSIITHQQMHQT
jgi:hypothetical protein